jgi:hypothetical protein
MHLYGWHLSSFKQALGSKDSDLLEAATARLSECFTEEADESTVSKAKAWLRTLIESGFPLREDREPPSAPADGGLLTVQMETEDHAFVVYCLARATARDDCMDLGSESSDWKYPAFQSLWDEFSTCGFTRSNKCPVELHNWMCRFLGGSPLFGDRFHTNWSFYTFFSNQELASMIPVYQAAADFKRTLAEAYPEEFRKERESLSEGGKKFIGDLIKWLGQIQQAGQHAFILWW